MQRMGLAQEFLQNIDAWAKTKAGTEEEPLLAPFIEEIAPIVTAFATGNAQVSKLPCKIPYPRMNTVTTAASRVSRTAEKPDLALPKKPEETKSPWVTVARKAAKLPATTPASIAQKSAPQPEPTLPTTEEDKRLFLRLGKEHEWRRLSPVSVKKMITERAGVAPSAIVAMYQVRSGLAFECVSDALRDSILRTAPSFLEENITLEAASDWTSVIAPNVPLYLKALDSRILVTNDMIKSECLSVCGVEPVQVRPTQVKLGQYSTSWLIHFKQKPVHLKFRLFHESGPAMPFVRRRPIEQCQRCWGFHSTRSCTKSQRCGRCTGTHEAAECAAKIPKCSNCAGPHESCSHNCMARPRCQNGQVTHRTPAELRIIRERGHRDFNAMLAESAKKGKAPATTNTPEQIMQDS